MNALPTTVSRRLLQNDCLGGRTLVSDAQQYTLATDAQEYTLDFRCTLDDIIIRLFMVSLTLYHLNVRDMMRMPIDLKLRCRCHSHTLHPLWYHSHTHQSGTLDSTLTQCGTRPDTRTPT